MEKWVKDFLAGVGIMVVVIIYLLEPFAPHFYGPIGPYEETYDQSDTVVLNDDATGTGARITLNVNYAKNTIEISIVGQHSLKSVESAELRVYFGEGTKILPRKTVNGTTSENAIVSETSDYSRYISLKSNGAKSLDEAPTDEFSMYCVHYCSVFGNSFSIMFAIGSDYGTDGLPGPSCSKTISTYSIESNN